MERFKDAEKYQKALCAGISILAYLMIWFLATNGTKLGIVRASPVEVLARFLSSLQTPSVPTISSATFCGASPGW